MIELSRSQIAELRGCTPATVSRAKLNKTAGGNYDLTDPEVWEYVTAPTVERAVYDHQKQMAEEFGDESVEGLEAEKLRADIEWKKKQSRKLDLQHEIDKKDLAPLEQVAIWIGYFSTGIRNNMLTLGKRVSRGDADLQARIDKHVTKAIDKTLETAEKQLRKETEKLTAYME